MIRNDTRNEHIAEKLHNATVIFTVWYRYPNIIQLATQSLLNAIENRPNTYCIIINSDGNPKVQHLFDAFNHDQCMMIDLPFNTGQTLATNFFFSKYIRADNLPKTVLSIDPDVLFSKASFDRLVRASESLPHCGMIGMRYTKNNCNPERNVWFKPRKLIGTDHAEYYVSKPFMCTVAGPVFAVSGDKLFHQCQNRLFPADRTFVYGGADSSLYAKLRWRYINGYLEGTEATHMQSNGKRSIDVKSHLQASNLIDYDELT